MGKALGQGQRGEDEGEDVGVELPGTHLYFSKVCEEPATYSCNLSDLELKS